MESFRERIGWKNPRKIRLRLGDSFSRDGSDHRTTVTIGTIGPGLEFPGDGTSMKLNSFFAVTKVSPIQ
jgi:hypothetical protein